MSTKYFTAQLTETGFGRTKGKLVIYLKWFAVFKQLSRGTHINLHCLAWNITQCALCCHLSEVICQYFGFTFSVIICWMFLCFCRVFQVIFMRTYKNFPHFFFFQYMVFKAINKDVIIGSILSTYYHAHIIRCFSFFILESAPLNISLSQNGCVLIFPVRCVMDYFYLFYFHV